MRVPVKLYIDVDPDQWAKEYGCPRRWVAADVRQYVGTLVYSQMVEEVQNATDVEREDP